MNSSQVCQAKPPSPPRLPHFTIIQRVIDAGARALLIPRLWPAEVTPEFRASFPNVTDEILLEFDQLLDEEVEQLKRSYAITLFRPDMFEFFQRAGLRRKPMASPI